MRTGLALLLLLGSCGPGAAKGAEGAPVECAVDGAAAFERSCVLERQGTMVVLHHPGGGFRRFELGSEGIAAADGADPAVVALLADGRLEVAVARDRYRLPIGIAR